MLLYHIGKAYTIHPQFIAAVVDVRSTRQIRSCHGVAPKELPSAGKRAIAEGSFGDAVRFDTGSVGKRRFPFWPQPARKTFKETIAVTRIQVARSMWKL